jgi:hypothetical protein
MMFPATLYVVNATRQHRKKGTIRLRFNRRKAAIKLVKVLISAQLARHLFSAVHRSLPVQLRFGRSLAVSSRRVCRLVKGDRAGPSCHIGRPLDLIRLSDISARMRDGRMQNCKNNVMACTENVHSQDLPICTCSVCCFMHISSRVS